MRGARLASIHSAAQNDAVWNLVGEHGVVMLGFSDFNEEGTWVWDDESEVNYTNWQQDRPRRDVNEGYAYMYMGPKWRDCNAHTQCKGAVSYTHLRAHET